MCLCPFRRQVDPSQNWENLDSEAPFFGKNHQPSFAKQRQVPGFQGPTAA